MQQLQIVRYGEIRQSVRYAEVAVPQVGVRDVLVRVSAASLNPIDHKIVSGALRLVQPLALPAPMGFDLAGVVAEVGSAVSQFKTGDRVFSRLPRSRMGSLAEFAVVDQAHVAPAPQTLNAVEASSVPLVGLTTVQALVDRAHALPGQHVLIHAGSGGLGSFAIQYAKHVLGLRVTTTTSRKNAEWVRGLGADEAIAYDEADYRRSPAVYDIVFDTLGGRTTADSLGIVRKGGTVVSVAGPPDRHFARQVGARVPVSWAIGLASLPMRMRAALAGAAYHRFLTESDGAQLHHLAEVIDRGSVRPIVDRVFPFDRAIEALEYLVRGRAKGKVVVAISAE